MMEVLFWLLDGKVMNRLQKLFWLRTLNTLRDTVCRFSVSVLCVLVLSSFVPREAAAVSTYSQVDRLEALLVQYDRFGEEHIVNSGTEVSPQRTEKSMAAEPWFLGTGESQSEVEDQTPFDDYVVAGESQKPLLEFFVPSRKYRLKDCMVKLNFLGDSEKDRELQAKVLDEIHPPILEAMSSDEYPYFSGGTTSANKYYIFYFVNQCEKRREYVQKLVEEKLLPYFREFPEYEIQHEGIEPGFDGVTPMGRWLDY